MPTPLLGACHYMHTSRKEAPQSVSFVSHSTASKFDSFVLIDNWTQVLKVCSVASSELLTFPLRATQWYNAILKPWILLKPFQGLTISLITHYDL